MPTTPVLKARGLNLSPNQLTVEEGSLSQAENIIIRRDDVIEPRRGFRLYGESFGTSTDTIKQMFVYRERLIRHYNDVLQFQNGTNNDGEVNFSNFSGSYTEAETGLRMKSIESNGNMYFTTSEGIKKISAKTASDLSTSSGYITNAGGIKALDIQAKLDIEAGGQTGFLPQDSAVAYRVLWNYYDANNNLIQGTPSQREEIYNSLEDLLIRDFNRLLLALDNINQSGSLVTDGTYVNTLKVAATGSASDIQTNSIALAAKLDADINICEGSVDTISASVPSATSVTVVTDTDLSTYLSVGDTVVLSGFVDVNLTQLNGKQFTISSFSTSGIANDTFTASNADYTLTTTGSHADTAVSIKRYKYSAITQPSSPSTPPTNGELLDIQDYISNIIVELQSEPTGIISSSLSTDFILPLDITTTANVNLTVTIPEAVTSDDFIQVYRSSISEASGATVLSDLIPNDEMQLVSEIYPSAAEISARTMTIFDETPDAFRGANLYTNEATGEGSTQANDLPPFAKDINRFKNSIFYANTRTRHRKLISLLGIENMITDFGTGQITKTFVSGDVDTSSNFIAIASHGFSEGQSIVFSGTDLPTGLTQGIIYYTLNVATNSFQVTTERDSTTPIDITAGGSGTHTVKNVLPKISVITADSKQTYSFIRGKKEVTQVVTVGDTLGSLDGKYFYIYSGNDETAYVIYMQKIGASDSNPLVPNKIAIPVYYTTGDGANTIAALIRNTINGLLSHDFSASVSTNTITITNVGYGYTTNASAQTSGFTVSTTVGGAGESISAKEILLSDDDSPAIAVDKTARSLIRVLNANTSEVINAFYLSTANTVPGRMFFESRELNESPFYIVGNDITVGESFSPDLSPQYSIKSISVANPTVVTTTEAHGLTTGNTIIIANSNSTPSIDGVYEVTVASSTTFTINVNVTVAGTTANFSTEDWIETSENEVKPNRVYYSKYSQPEAVPLTNYFDVGAEEKEILRIFPLRDSLFVFKQDGIYRISGEEIPFSVGLFDGSSRLVVPDSLDAIDNLIYMWSEQGIVTVSESGVSSPISRPIDTVLLKLATSQYENFLTATFGLGYDSDNAYYIWTVTNTEDEVATKCYRFSTLTSTWTTFNKFNTCGIISSVDDKMYLGAADTNYIEQERKDFTRYDYADREIDIELNEGRYSYNNARLNFNTLISTFEVGDVIVQNQTLTTYVFNGLLNKLDYDPGLADNDYFDTLEVNPGDNLKTSLLDLAAKLDADANANDTDYESTIAHKTGTITGIAIGDPVVITDNSHGLVTGRWITIAGSNSTPSINGDYEVTVINADSFSISGVEVTTAGTTGSWITIDSNFDDLKTCYNELISKLNNDNGVSFSNYQEIDGTTPQEAIITEIDTNNNYVYINNALNFVVGDMILYKAIQSSFTYCPNSGGDPYSYKHFRQSTMMFESKAFTSASLSFASDLLPELLEVPFDGDGNGMFGGDEFGEGFFGGASNGEPLRTLIPLEKQRCRYLNVKFKHRIARESYAIFGTTLTYDPYALPDRAYRR